MIYNDAYRPILGASKHHLDAQSTNQPAVGSAAGILIPAVGTGAIG